MRRRYTTLTMTLIGISVLGLGCDGGIGTPGSGDGHVAKNLVTGEQKTFATLDEIPADFAICKGDNCAEVCTSRDCAVTVPAPPIGPQSCFALDAKSCENRRDCQWGPGICPLYCPAGADCPPCVERCVPRPQPRSCSDQLYRARCESQDGCEWVDQVEPIPFPTPLPLPPSGGSGGSTPSSGGDADQGMPGSDPLPVDAGAAPLPERLIAPNYGFCRDKKPPVCPSYPTIDIGCPRGHHAVPKRDRNGCVIGYVCVPDKPRPCSETRDQSACASNPSCSWEPIFCALFLCAEGADCPPCAGGVCVDRPACPPVATPICGPNQKPVPSGRDRNGCVTGYVCKDDLPCKGRAERSCSESPACRWQPIACTLADRAALCAEPGCGSCIGECVDREPICKPAPPVPEPCDGTSVQVRDPSGCIVSWICEPKTCSSHGDPNSCSADAACEWEQAACTLDAPSSSSDPAGARATQPAFCYPGPDGSGCAPCPLGFCRAKTRVCPLIGIRPAPCENGQTPEPIKDEYGCVVGYKCPVDKQCAATDKAACEADKACSWEPLFCIQLCVSDGNGGCLPCQSGGVCQKRPVACPLFYPLPPICEGGVKPEPTNNEDGCLIGWTCPNTKTP